jgi:hypothetical protein
MAFNKAVKTKQWLRLAIDGISGSGKTFTALATAIGMAKAMKGKVALIDSEHGSASLYADRFDFDTLELTEFQIENYIEALNEAQKAGYEIVIIDSTSHAWDALVERVERIAHQRFNGNTFRAWAEGTPLQKKLIEAMLTYPGHIIVTCRSKTEYSVDKDEKGKTTVKKVGTAAVQRQGFEYEFTMAMTMDINHVGAVTKDRTGKFQDKFLDKPGEKFGEQLIAWLNEGAAPIPKPQPQPQTPPSTPPSGNTQAAAKQKTERQIVINEIGAILTTLNPDGFVFFSDDEKKDAREIVKTNDINGLKELASVLHKTLEERKASFKPISWDDPAPGTAEPEAKQPPDDGFVDDIPWGEGEEPGKKKGKGAKPKTAPANETPSEELAIF